MRAVTGRIGGVVGDGLERRINEGLIARRNSVGISINRAARRRVYQRIPLRCGASIVVIEQTANVAGIGQHIDINIAGAVPRRTPIGHNGLTTTFATAASSRRVIIAGIQREIGSFKEK